MRRGDTQAAAEINQMIVAAKNAPRESRGPAASREWVNEGKTPDQLLQEKIDGPAQELAFQIAEEARSQDFAPNELPKAIEAWAKDSSVPADQFRQTVLKSLDKTDISDAQKARVRKALSPLRERAKALKPKPAEPSPPVEATGATRGQEAQEEPQEVLSTAPAQRVSAPAAQVGSVEGQKGLAYRASRIASLLAMNEQIKKIDPSEAWHPDNITDSRDLDALQDSISETLVRLQRERAARPNSQIAQPEQVQEQPAVATHADPGQPPEPATTAVVAEAVAKAAKREGVKPGQMLSEALKLIDAAIASAPTADEAEQDAKKKGGMFSRATTIDVPGDGTFKVVNTKERLREFRKKVEASPGFKTQKPGPTESKRVNGYGMQNEPGSPFGVESGSGGTKASIENMIDDGDPQAAVDYAAARGLDITEVLKGDKARLAKVSGLTRTEPATEEAAPVNATAPTKPQPAPTGETAAAQGAVAPSLKDRVEAMKPSREVIEFRKRLAVLIRLKECLS